ncbi:MAG: glutamine-hydrolyzing GMP synthase [Nanoarchaeota archaeon]|nr:glutamine-hydrolyzing GMP synthase [Nanoarchaeota archaeon]
MEKILVIDYGSQYTHLLARNIRRLNVYSEIKQPDVTKKDLKDVKGIILSGGPNSVYEKNAPKISKKILESGIPILGVCYGHQLISHMLGGKLERGDSMEYGFAMMKTEKNPLFKGLSKQEVVWMSHGDHVKELPEGFQSIGYTDRCQNAAVCNKEKNIFGLQFHPEVTHTRNGMTILDNFVNLCDAKREWKIENYIESLKAKLKKKIAGKKVFLLVSGGVDSTVTFRLLNEALGKDKVIGLHIDNGFMRHKESCHIIKEFKKLGLNVKKIDCSEYFLKKIGKTTDPETKRKIIGKAFIDVTNKAIKQTGLDKNSILSQGTIYPDTIESGDTKNSDKIKTHHNRVSIVREMIEKGQIIEPIKDLYKDEVRLIGYKLKIPSHMIKRHPFPGPGLAIRCLCSDRTRKISKRLQKKVDNVIDPYFLTSKVLPIRSVGVQGDSRTYRNPAMIIGEADWDKLNTISTEICNKVEEINRVVWHVAGDKDLDLRKAYLTKERLDLLREVDLTVRTFICKNDYNNRIWQMPIVLLPLGTDGKEAIVLRPICSTEVMTANFTRMDQDDVKRLAKIILKNKKISAIMYDITNKPPGTVEWE